MEHYARYTDSTRLILPVLDGLLIFGAFRLTSYVLGAAWHLAGYAAFFVAFVLLWGVLSQQYANIFRLDRLISYREKLFYLVRTFMLHALVLLGLALLLGVRWMPLGHLALVYGLALGGVGLGRFGLAFCYRIYLRHLAPPHSRFVLVGASASGLELYHFRQAHDPAGNQFQGLFVDEPVPPALQHLVRGRVADVKAYCQGTPVDEIYFALPFTRQDLIKDLGDFATEHFMSLRIVPDYEGTMGRQVSVHHYDRLPVLAVRREPLALWTNAVLKRAFDVVFSLLALAVLVPLVLPPLALAIRLDSPGPVFFRQLRPGRRNRLFPCYKLRTMRCDHGRPELQATQADPRVTRLGRYLRKYNLDELPQFYNVLLGHMSVVGPRPNMISQLEEYSKRIRTYHWRHAVMPGITGYAQVNGYRGETRAPQAMEKRVEYDLKYLENWTFGLDLLIIGQTLRNMLRGEKNAY